jgi:hypothetical protein
MLTQEQKDSIISIATSSCTNREKQSHQAITNGDFSAIVPEISISTFENIMYEAGYSRRRPRWKPTLTPAQERERYAWALAHNPDNDEVGDNLGYNFGNVVFTDETPARVGEERGMIRAWARNDEVYDVVRHDRNRKDCCLQFFGAFRHNHKGPCHVYFQETKTEKEAADMALEEENEAIRAPSNHRQTRARRALQEMQEL